MRKVLIANRGEVAVRIIRACRDLDLRSVAVYSECDRTALHVRMADEAYAIGPSPATDSYLRIDRLIDAARRAGADGVHPGYGFLAEQPALADACRDAGLTFIGPSAEAIALMGSKTAARRVARRAGVPVVPGSEEALPGEASDDEIVARGAEVGFPLLVKAVAGGGGKGMRLVERPEDLWPAVRTARSEALSAFGEAAVYLERQLVRPRHVEVQLLGDATGTVLPFVERECSIQRRHQKLLEETPSPVVTPDLREAMTGAAARIAREVGYTNAGTIEFLLEEGRGTAGADQPRFHFLEMNTRLQVEHPITEWVSGIDLVAWQLRLARGERLLGPDGSGVDPRRLLQPAGHALECRVYAEDPDVGFLPSPGTVEELWPPAGPGVRDDTGVVAGSEISVFYDALVSKVSTWGETRPVAIARMRRAMAEYRIRGVRTTIPFFRTLLERPEFQAGLVDTSFVDRLLAAGGDPGVGRLPSAGSDPGADRLLAAPDVETVALVAASLHLWHLGGAGDRRVQPDAGNTWTRQARAEALR